MKRDRKLGECSQLISLMQHVTYARYPTSWRVFGFFDRQAGCKHARAHSRNSQQLEVSGARLIRFSHVAHRGNSTGHLPIAVSFTDPTSGEEKARPMASPPPSKNTQFAFDISDRHCQHDSLPCQPVQKWNNEIRLKVEQNPAEENILTAQFQASLATKRVCVCVCISCDANWLAGQLYFTYYKYGVCHFQLSEHVEK